MILNETETYPGIDVGKKILLIYCVQSQFCWIFSLHEVPQKTLFYAPV